MSRLLIRNGRILDPLAGREEEIGVPGRSGVVGPEDASLARWNPKIILEA